MDLLRNHTRSHWQVVGAAKPSAALRRTSVGRSSPRSVKQANALIWPARELSRSSCPERTTNQWSRSKPGGFAFQISHCRIFIARDAGWLLHQRPSQGAVAAAGISCTRTRSNPRDEGLGISRRLRPDLHEWPGAGRWLVSRRLTMPFYELAFQAPHPNQPLFSSAAICTFLHLIAIPRQMPMGFRCLNQDALQPNPFRKEIANGRLSSLIVTWIERCDQEWAITG